MKVVVTTRGVYADDIIGDLTSRRSLLQSAYPGPRRDDVVITAMTPLVNLFGYGIGLRAMTHDRANFRMAYDHYQAVPDARSPDLPFPPAIGMRA
jgi:elongation factor G